MSNLEELLHLSTLNHPHHGTFNIKPIQNIKKHNLVCLFISGSGGIMRQLKGKPKKETSKDKKERKQAMQEARQQVATVVVPTLAVVVLLIVVFVYVATRPGAVE